MEKHWKSVINRSICDYLFEEQKKISNFDTIPPVIPTPRHILINIHRCKLYFVAVLSTECPPLFIIEFLHKIVDTIIDYFQDCNETIIKENYIVVYEVLDEMLDNGFPLITESNILKELIKPPNILRTIANTVTGKSNLSSDLPKGQLSNVPWRRTGIKYSNNEAYFDVIEEIDAIIDKFGSVIFSEVQGNIDCAIKLSGMPELTMNFTNPRILDDSSFHLCVRLKHWETEKKLNFIPPDGNFRLMSYKVNSNLATNNMIPLHVQHSITYSNPSNSSEISASKSSGGGGNNLYNYSSSNVNANHNNATSNFSRSSTGKLDIVVAPRNTAGKNIENCTIDMLMPKAVSNMCLTPSQGTYSFDTVTKVLEWDIGRIELYKSAPQLKGTISLQSGSPPPEFNPTINLHFDIPQLAISGLRVCRLDMSQAEKYKPFKGVKYLTKAGKFQIRT
ncbi:unnamed protein product [Gordionus sp. m RMFG-2023]